MIMEVRNLVGRLMMVKIMIDRVNQWRLDEAVKHKRIPAGEPGV